MPYLKFISDEDLVAAVGYVISKAKAAETNATTKLYKNVIDPFSALFDSVTHGITYDEWMVFEKARQAQKTLQNAIGDFHQQVLGSVVGWQNLGSGGGLDVANEKMKIIAEIKNKFNTTKGNHKVEIYDAIESKLKTKEYSGYVGYYVEIISQGRKKYNAPFTPSDNKKNEKTEKRRLDNEKIRIIDGISFYALATGRGNALKDLYEVLPDVMVENFDYKIKGEEAFRYFDLFRKAFSTE